MYCIDNKVTLICIIVITMNSYFIHTIPINTIFISDSDLDLSTFLTMRTEACNIRGCFFPMKFYFVEDPLIICPSGFDLKLAFKDQEGRFRVGSVNNNHSKKKIIENCIRHTKKVTTSATPNYMKPTISSDAKTIKKPSTQLHHSTLIQKQDEFLETTNQYIFPPSSIMKDDSIMTDDLSEISDESYKTAQLSFEDSLYVKHSFPQNMFDDKGDIVYGTGLMGLLLSFICTLIKLILEKQKNKQLSDLPHHLPKTSTLLAPPGSNNRNLYSEPFLTRNITPRVPESNVSNHYYLPTHVPHTSCSTALASDETKNLHFHTALPHPPSASQLAEFASNNTNAQLSQNQNVLVTTQSSAPVSNLIAQQIPRVILNPNCDCPKANCIQGNCHCYKAKRACVPSCHGGAGTSINCKATLEYAARVYNC